MLVANLLTAFLNYLYHFIAGRFLAPAEYGRLESIITLNYFMSVFTGAFLFSAINFLGNVKKKKINSAVHALKKLALKITLILEIVFLISIPFLKRFLRLDNYNLLLIYALWLSFSLLPLVFSAALQSRLKFFYAASANVLATFFKLLTTLLFLLWEGKETTALSGWIIFSIVLLIINYIFVNKIWGKQPIEEIQITNKFWHFSSLALIVNLSLTSLYSSDILLVRFFFTETQSGIYSALSVLGKIIFFGATAILMVSYPLFIKYQRNIKRLKQTFLFSFVFVFSIAALGILAYLLFPHLFIKILYGNQYKAVGQHMFKFALFTGLLAVFNFLCRFFLALETKLIGLIAGISAFTQLLLIFLNHGSINNIINSSICSLLLGIFLALVLLFFYWSNYEKHN